MRIDADLDREQVEEIWKNCKFVEIDELGFYHFEIKVTEKKIIDFAIEPSLAIIYKSLIREMEQMHVKNQRDSYIANDDFRTPFTALSDAVKPIDEMLSTGLRIKHR